MKNVFSSHAWALKKTDGKFVQAEDMGYYDQEGPAMYLTREHARDMKRSICNNARVVKVVMTIKEAA